MSGPHFHRGLRSFSSRGQSSLHRRSESPQRQAKGSPHSRGHAGGAAQLAMGPKEPKRNEEEEAEEAAQQPAETSGAGAEQTKGLSHLAQHDTARGRSVSVEKLTGAMKELVAAQVEADQARRQREKELSRVKVSDADVLVIAKEFEVDKRTAERRLRENAGDLKRTLEFMLGAVPCTVGTMAQRGQ